MSLDRRAGRVCRFFLLFILCASLSACATSSHARGGRSDFAGGWSVEWCDKTNPALDCGGFNITLIQEGDRICGDYGSALVNLRQMDDGSIIGTVVGDTAVLAVESSRDGSISLVRAVLDAGILHWRNVDTIRRGEGDISIVATNDFLKRDVAKIQPPDVNSGAKKTCGSLSGQAGG